MTDMLSALLLVLSPLLAAVLPFLVERYGLAERVSLPSLPRLRRSGYAPLPGHFVAPSLEHEPRLWWQRVIARGAIMLVASVVTLSVVTSLSSSASVALVLVGAIAGLIVGALAISATRTVRDAFRSLRPARALRGLGLSGVHDSNDPESFKKTLLETVRTSGNLDLVCSDGVEILTALSHNARPALDAPHPDLRGAKVCLYLVPPRSGTIDPETRGRTTAEIALARLGMSPEEHWRQLNTTFRTQERWSKEYGLSLQIRYLERRPSFRVVHAGSRFWFHPWEARSAWLETGPDPQSGFNRTMRHTLIEAAANSTAELRHIPQPGPSKTTFIKKGVEVPGMSTTPPESALTVEDCTENDFELV